MTSRGSHDSSLSGYSLDVLTDEELVKLVNDLRKEVKLINLENEVLEKSIMRLDPALMHGVYQAWEYATKPQTGSMQNIGSFIKTQASRFGLIESLLCPSKMFSSPSRIMSTRRIDSQGRICGSVVTGGGPKINLNERLELLAIVIDNQIKDLEKSRRNGVKRQAYLKASLEETELVTAEIEKFTEQFQQEVVTEGYDRITQRIPAEIWVRFMAEWLKKTDRQIGRLRLRTSTLNIQYRKLKEEIESKRELSELLVPVDFDKIKIENAECMKAIENKNIQLDELKEMAGEANLNLAIHKKAMQFLNTYLAKVRKLKTRRENQTVQLDKETDLIQIQVDILQNKIADIKKMRMMYQIPNVVDYVNVKAAASEISYAIKRLETRLHIKQVALASTNKQIKVLMSRRSLPTSSESLLD